MENLPTSRISPVCHILDLQSKGQRNDYSDLISSTTYSSPKRLATMLLITQFRLNQSLVRLHRLIATISIRDT